MFQWAKQWNKLTFISGSSGFLQRVIQALPIILLKLCHQQLFNSHWSKQLQMLLFPNSNISVVHYIIFTKFLPANNFCQLLRVTRKLSCTSADNVQAQLHFRDDQQRAFGISNISNCHTIVLKRCLLKPATKNLLVWRSLNERAVYKEDNLSCLCIPKYLTLPNVYIGKIQFKLSENSKF